MTPSNSEILLHWIPHFDTTVLSLTLEGYHDLLVENLKGRQMVLLYAKIPNQQQVLEHYAVGRITGVEGLDDTGLLLKAEIHRECFKPEVSPVPVNARCLVKQIPYHEGLRLLRINEFFVIP